MMKSRLPIAAIATLFVLQASTGSAAFLCSQTHMKEFLFGLEFTLTNQTIVNEGNANPKVYGFENNPVKKEHWEKLIEKLKERCKTSGDCTASMSRDKHGPAWKFTFKDDYYFTVGIDSAVLEVNAPPATTEGFKAVSARMQDYVFGTARSVGLQPHDRAGGGHIHISRKAFEENSLAFFNFSVDFQNRPELVYGALGNHLGNSAPLAALKPEQRDAFQKMAAEFDPAKTDINTYVNELNRKVFTSGFFAEWGSPNYYQAFNMTRMQNAPNSATLEIRSFRPQKDANAYQLQIQLLEAWVNKVKGLKTKVPYVRKDRHEYSPQEIVNSFAQLVHDLGLPYATFKVLLPENMQRLTPNLTTQALGYSLRGIE